MKGRHNEANCAQELPDHADHEPDRDQWSLRPLGAFFFEGLRRLSALDEQLLLLPRAGRRQPDRIRAMGPVKTARRHRGMVLKVVLPAERRDIAEVDPTPWPNLRHPRPAASIAAEIFERRVRWL